jgi:phenylacetate-coenzyme A ligase PaaK-like adenylate-forming protein
MGLKSFLDKHQTYARNMKLDREAILRIQDEKLRWLLKHAHASSPYYRRALAGIDLDRCTLSDLPILERDTVRNRLEELVIDPEIKVDRLREFVSDYSNIGKLYLGKYVPFHTSGSTGENVLVLTNRDELEHMYAIFGARPAKFRNPPAMQTLKATLRHFFVRRERTATFVLAAPFGTYTAAKHFNRKFLKVLLGDQHIIDMFTPTDRLVEDLNRIQPDSIVSYPSLLAQLAREQLAGRLKLRLDSPFSSLMCGSEPMTEMTRDLVRRAFGLEIQDIYGATECTSIGRSCAKNRMHQMSDACIVEVVDEKKRPVPDGEVGTSLLVTNLNNSVLPIIRYELTDVTGYSREACDCGWPFPVLLPIEGRTGDIFYVERERGGYAAMHPYVFMAAIAHVHEIRVAQVVQDARNHFTLKYVPNTKRPELQASLREAVDHQLAAASMLGRVSVDYVEVEDIPRDPKTGKLKQMISLVGAPSDLTERERAFDDAPPVHSISAA